MTRQNSKAAYFPQSIQISAKHWRSLDLGELSDSITRQNIPPVIFYRQLAFRLNRNKANGRLPVHAADLQIYSTLLKVYRHVIAVFEASNSSGLLNALAATGYNLLLPESRAMLSHFVELFPPEAVLNGKLTGEDWLAESGESGFKLVLQELFLLRLASINRSVDNFREILDDAPLLQENSYIKLNLHLQETLKKEPVLAGFGCTLGEALLAPINAAEGSLADQLDFVRRKWGKLLPAELLEEITITFDILDEERREWGGSGKEPVSAPVLEFKVEKKFSDSAGSSVFGGYDYPEYEHFSLDSDWMSNVVLIAKMVYVWLDQLSKQYGFPIIRLDQVPDAELNRLADAGITGLWLIGIWERSPASEKIKQLCGNSDAIASAYSLYDYEISADLGGWQALANLRERAALRGIRLASDMVPNHTGIYSRWVIQHPDWFVQTDYPPFPSYQFNGADLSESGDISIQIEDGYWTKTDAAVVFRLIEHKTGRIRYIYHGNDGTSTPWNDTAQLNYLLPELRESVIQTILHVARNFPIIRFDAAMTLAKKHYQRLWFPIRGLAGGIPSRSEHAISREEFDTLFPIEFWREVVDRVAIEAPDTLLLAEAFWLMEGYFVRTLGMHRVYNSAFMNMLKMEENANYRQTIKNVLEFNPQVLKRFVNFMNNPDEETAAGQFGTERKYFGVAVLLATMPGLPMFGHGQFEGFREKYGMEYKRAYFDETTDNGLMRGHQLWIFPLLKRRYLFAEVENFVLYDFYAGTGVDENIFAYSNRVGEQKAVVIYNNHYGASAGWIRESAAFAVKVDGDNAELRRTSLGETFTLSAKKNFFSIFRDQITELEYIRSNGELIEKGLYLELSEYQFHVFIDFSEINDFDGSWQALATELNGCGVKNLENERKQLLYKSLNSAFRAALAALIPVVATFPEKQAGAELQQLLDQFFIAIEQQSVADGKPDLALRKKLASKTAEIMDHLLGWQALKIDLKNLKYSKATAEALRVKLLELSANDFNLYFLSAWLLLHQRETNCLQDFGLDYSIKFIFEKIGNGAMPDRLIKLLKALLELDNADKSEGKSVLALAFISAECRDFMLVHKSNNVEWFNQENFEELLESITMIKLFNFSFGKPSKSRLSEWLDNAVAELESCKVMAAESGYRCNLFQKRAGI